MRNKVYIKLGSIEQTKPSMLGPKELQIEFTSVGYPTQFEKDNNIILIRVSQDHYGRMVYEIRITESINIDSLVALINVTGGDTNYNVSQDSIDIRTLDDWDFEYDESSQIDCPSCGSIFNYKHVVEREDLSDSCPVCHETINIEFESIGDALIRKDKKEWI